LAAVTTPASSSLVVGVLCAGMALQAIFAAVFQRQAACAVLLYQEASERADRAETALEQLRRACYRQEDFEEQDEDPAPAPAYAADDIKGTVSGNAAKCWGRPHEVHCGVGLAPGPGDEEYKVFLLGGLL
jgi:hypothetical protein